MHRFFVQQLLAMARLGFLKLAKEKETRQHWNVTRVVRSAKNKLNLTKVMLQQNLVHCRAQPLRDEQGYEVPMQSRKFSEDLH